MICVNTRADAMPQIGAGHNGNGHADMHIRSIVIALGLASVLATDAGLAVAQPSPAAQGEAIARRHCGRCHAIGETDASPMGIAPPFRDLSKRYPIESLEEALAEGIIVGHPAMPRFTFEPREINALLTYISGLKNRNPSNQKQ
jgi:mono/diheme cytochrome c family protein